MLKDNENIRFGLVGFLLVLLIILCPVPRGYTVWYFSTGPINRPYGSGIGITIPLLFFLSMFFLTIKKSEIIVLKTPLPYFFLFAVFSIVFPVGERFWNTTIIGVIKMITFWGIYNIISRDIIFKEFKKCLSYGFTISLIIETIIGVLFVFGGVSIPYITYSSSMIRNGLSRMSGAMPAPGDFSLYIGIVYLYFISNFLFEGDKKKIILILICIFDLILSGTRTILVAVALITIVLLWKKFKNNWQLRIILFGLGGITSVLIYYSSYFQNLFINNNFSEMLTARLIHLNIGLHIIFSSAQNFMFGVGLNSHVDYIYKNFLSISYLITDPTALNPNFVMNMPIHNAFIIVFTELGILGLVLYSLIYFKSTIRAFKIIKINSKWKSECYFIISSFVLFFIYAFQGWSLMKDMSWILLIIICAFLDSLFKEIKLEKNNY